MILSNLWIKVIAVFMATVLDGDDCTGLQPEEREEHPGYVLGQIGSYLSKFSFVLLQLRSPLITVR